MRYRSGEDLGLDMHTDDSDRAGKVDACESYGAVFGMWGSNGLHIYPHITYHISLWGWIRILGLLELSL